MRLTISRYTAISILCMAFAATASARSWRIHHNAKQLADFADINASVASDQVLDGDTLYLDPGCILSSAQTVTKQLTIIGCGFSGVTQPYAFAKINGALNLKAVGIKVMSAILSSVSIQASDITLERCRISGAVASSGSASCANATIRQCYMTYGTGSSSAITGFGSGNTNSMDWTIENSIIKVDGSAVTAIRRLFNAKIRNNLIYGNPTSSSWPALLVEVGSSQIQNNIIINTANAEKVFSSTDTDQMLNNVISQNVAADYNHVGVLTLDAVYTGDLQSYELIDESPAKNYGVDGTDCGIFGGMHPYVKGGRPFGHPYYSEIKVASMSDENDKLKVSLKIKMNDE